MPDEPERTAYLHRLDWIEKLKLSPYEEYIAGIVASLERYVERGGPGLRVEVDWPVFMKSLTAGADVGLVEQVRHRSGLEGGTRP